MLCFWQLVQLRSLLRLLLLLDGVWMRPVPGWLFPPLFFAGVAILLAGGVQYQVGRKQRTYFNDQVYIEDSSLGGAKQRLLKVLKAA